MAALQLTVLRSVFIDSIPHRPRTSMGRMQASRAITFFFAEEPHKIDKAMDQ